MTGSGTLTGRMKIPLFRGFPLRVEWLTVAVLTVALGFTEGANDVVVKPIDKVKELRCYKCLDYDRHCMTLANVSAVAIANCQPDETFCQVKRLHLQEDLLTFERSCASTCVPGCEKAGDYKRCSSCCDKHLCNVDSAASSIPNAKVVASLFAVSWALYLGIY